MDLIIESAAGRLSARPGKATLQAWFVAEGVSTADVDALLDDGGTVLV